LPSPRPGTLDRSEARSFRDQLRSAARRSIVLLRKRDGSSKRIERPIPHHPDPLQKPISEDHALDHDARYQDFDADA
jgi:hypothetical protein